MRVIAGKLKSRQLKAVNSSLTRPTTDRNKENLFNLIGPFFEGGVCLDLFGGSGSLGIEAVSRGVDELYCVDKQYKAYTTIKDNIQKLNIESQSHVYKWDCWKALDHFKSQGIKFDLIFLDPPYGLKINQKILDYMVKNSMLHNNCLIVIEDANEETIDIQLPFHLKKQQSYGMTTLQIIRYKE